MTEGTMRRVTGIGGVFFKARDPEALRAWYQRHLGVSPGTESGFGEGTVAFRWGGEIAHTVWGPFPDDTNYFEPSRAPFMLNYRVADLDALIEALVAEGVEVDDRIEEYPYGRFAWLMDPEGNRIELWEPAPGL